MRRLILVASGAVLLFVLLRVNDRGRGVVANDTYRFDQAGSVRGYSPPGTPDAAGKTEGPSSGGASLEAGALRSAVAVVSGRVVDSEGEPVLGCRLGWKDGAINRRLDVSDELGRFGFLLPEPLGSVLVDVPYEWDAPAEVALTSEQRSGAAPLVIRAVRARTCVLKGIALASGAGVPVSRLALRIKAEGLPTQEVTTNAEGAFRSQLEIRLGEVTVESASLRDAKVLNGVIEHRDDQGVRLSVETGWMCRLDLRRPAAARGPWIARLRRETSSPLWVTAAQVSVESGELPILRFPRSGHSGRSRLEVSDRAGGWFGVTRVEAQRGFESEPVTVVVDSAGSLTGAIVDEEGRPLARVRVTALEFLPGSDSSDVQEPGRRSLVVADPVLTDDEGRWELSALAEGVYLVAADPLRLPLVLTEVTVEASERTEVRLVAGAQSSLRKPVAIEGRILARGKALLPAVTLSSRRTSPVDGLEDAWRTKATNRVTQRVSWRREGELWVGGFSVPALDRFQYGIRLDAPPYEVEPHEVVVTPPADGLVFECRNDVPVYELELRVRDAVTQKPVQRPYCLVLEGQIRGSSPLLIRNLPCGIEVPITVGASGYDQQVLEYSSRHAGSTQRLDVDLTERRVAER